MSEYVQARMATLQMRVGELEKLTGLSGRTLQPFLHGKVTTKGPRPENRGRVADALGWTRGSIDRILNGGEPELAEHQGTIVPDSMGPPRLLAAEDAIPKIVLAVADLMAHAESLGLGTDELVARARQVVHLNREAEMAARGGTAGHVTEVGTWSPLPRPSPREESDAP